MTTFTLQDAFNELKASIVKQWGIVPAEIENELKAIEILITPVEEPKAEKPADL